LEDVVSNKYRGFVIAVPQAVSDNWCERNLSRVAKYAYARAQSNATDANGNLTFSCVVGTYTVTTVTGTRTGTYLVLACEYRDEDMAPAGKFPADQECAEGHPCRELSQRGPVAKQVEAFIATL